MNLATPASLRTRAQTVVDDTSQRIAVDPVTFEVLNHRLMTISEEMGIQYMRCSGSNVLITGNDAAAAIMLADGSLVSVGP
jgi:N-methylhydantoinase B/oxoprolinase/acetone carboxylase alpha subunit